IRDRRSAPRSLQRGPLWLRLSATGQLLPQRRQRFVRGQGAVVLSSLRRIGGCLADLGSRLRIGPLGVGELLAVRVEPFTSGGVPLLPRLALAVVARQPFLAVRVEALGVDVVALVVVLGFHAVLRGVEVILGERALVG